MIQRITIEAVLNGFICKVGCQTVVFETAGKLKSELDGYLANPDIVAKNYLKLACNAAHVCSGPIGDEAPRDNPRMPPRRDDIPPSGVPLYPLRPPTT